MSDFIYSRKTKEQGKLTKEIQAIYHEDSPLVKEFHGKWGSLAISCNLYNGFQPYETEDYILAVIGGPVLYFRDNKFLKEDLTNTGTKAIFNRWYDGDLKWDEDLSGPFTIIILNKNSSDIQIVTDIMSFIPVYIYQNTTDIFLSTHVDMLASISRQKENIDVISYADFILHSAVTFPYTMYKDIFQVKPASIHHIYGRKNMMDSQAYWIPEENNNFSSIKEAAYELRKGLKKYINSITSEVNEVAQFISGGEDSRVLSGLLQKYPRNAFIFLDQMNREGVMAKKAAEAYGANFILAKRTSTHYLEILPSCSDLVGSGSQYHHAHTFGFHKSCKLNEYSAVFGGLLSDALLKGSHIKRKRNSNRFPLFPDIIDHGYSVENIEDKNLFTSEVIDNLKVRRKSHLEYIKNFRDKSAEEWFELWPSSMNMNIPNIHANRRLFRSYEPFTANDIVKISASVPQNWKLNRRLFHLAVKPFLKSTKWLFHTDGRLPYFPWHINSHIQFVYKVYRLIGLKAGIIKGNQGPWGEWNVVMQSNQWKETINRYSGGFSEISFIFKEKDLWKIFEYGCLTNMQRTNLMQVLYQIGRIKE